MNYAEATRYLISLGNEIRAAGAEGVAAKLGLENITPLLADLNNPQNSYPSVLIAGTNGKGSVSAMIESVLREAGLRTGLYTSPHLVEISERISLGGEEIPQADFADLFTRLRGRIERLLASGTLRFHPTYFECLTAMAMEYFREQHVDVAVLEVGMGGRLDATNTASPEVAVITQIDLDHERFLGSTIAAIATEKAGIIKSSASYRPTVVSSPQHPEAAEVIRDRCARQGVRLVEVATEYAISEPASEAGLYEFCIRDRAGWSLHLQPALRGRHQIENAVTATAAVKELASRGYKISDENIQKGIAYTTWRGRLEMVRKDPPTFLDGAHNPAGARALAQFWDDHLGQRRIVLVYGAMRDKAILEVADMLFPKAYAVIVTRPDQERAATPEAVLDITHHLNPRIILESSPLKAMEIATELASEADDDASIFATGSLFLVGDLRRAGYRS
jgi:dihydrofolate synthase / folylpolyglutamate synthase